MLVKVAAEGATAEMRVTLQISGQGKLALTAKDGRLSGEAEAGKARPIRWCSPMTAPRRLEDVELSGIAAGRLEGRVRSQDHRRASRPTRRWTCRRW